MRHFNTNLNYDYSKLRLVLEQVGCDSGADEGVEEMGECNGDKHYV